MKRCAVAGEASMGMKHVTFVKKPDAFQLGSADPDDPKVQKTLGQLGVSSLSKMPKPMQLVRAQLDHRDQRTPVEMRQAS